MEADLHNVEKAVRYVTIFHIDTKDEFAVVHINKGTERVALYFDNAVDVRQFCEDVLKSLQEQTALETDRKGRVSLP